MESLDYYHLLFRRKWIIVICVVTTMFAVSLYSYFSRPLFEANAELLLVDNKDMNSLQGISFENMIMGTLGKSDPISTQIEILKTRTVMEDVLKKISLTDEKGNPIKTEDLIKKFKFEAIRNTNIVSIRFRNENPQKAALVVNTLSRVFIEKNQQLNQDEVNSTKQFIEDQLIVQKMKVDDAQRALIEFKSHAQIVSFGKETDVYISALAELEAKKIRLESEQKSILAQKTAVDSKLNKSGSQDAPLYSNWYASSEQLSINSATLESQLNTISQQIRTQYRILKARPKLEIEYARLAREENFATGIYTNLLSRHEEIKIKAAAKIASIKIIDPAVIPDKPISPNRKKTLPLAFAGGLFLGLGFAFSVEYFKSGQDQVIKSSS